MTKSVYICMSKEVFPMHCLFFLILSFMPFTLLAQTESNASEYCRFVQKDKRWHVLEFAIGGEQRFSPRITDFYFGDATTAKDGKPIVSNDGYLPWVIRDMLNVDVELYEKFGSRLFLQARRSSSSAYFTITITLTDGMTYKANNPYGSLEIYEHGFTITPWVKKA